MKWIYVVMSLSAWASTSVANDHEVNVGAYLPNGPAGPMALELPVGFCDTAPQKSVGKNSLEHPLALASKDPRTKALLRKAHKDRATASMRKHYCKPVLNEAMSLDVKRAVDPSCFQEVPMEALVSPIHPLADLARADVQEAIALHSQALNYVADLRERCKQQAQNARLYTR